MDERRFELKGKRAEEFVYALATKSFLTDWCYLNPRLPDGKELCDLLVVFDDTAIIWQVKDLKLDDTGHYSQGEVEKNLRQLAGARRTLFELKKPILLKNPHRGDEAFAPDTIKKVFLISALLGEAEDFHSPFAEAKKHVVHVFTRQFTEIVLTELDTISDFTAYLYKREEVLTSSEEEMRFIVNGGEEELLAMYILNNRSFPFLDQSISLAIVEDGHWESLQQRPEYIERKSLDDISYAWDDMISLAHLSNNPDYERVARELARLNRFERRVISKTMLDAWLTAQKTPGDLFRRTMIADDVTYCLLFLDERISREKRRGLLYAQCLVGRGTAKQNRRVLGIASEKQFGPTCSYDFVFLDIPEWTEEHQKDMEQLQQEAGIMQNVTWRHVDECEYPNRKA